MRIRILSTFTMALVACLFLGPMAAADGNPTMITVGLEPAFIADVSDNATARVTTADGAPLGNMTVEFRLAVELLGARTAFLGTAVTDANGVARFPLIARQPVHVVEARFEGTEAYAGSVGTGSLQFPQERLRPVSFASPESQLTSLRVVLPRVLGLVVAALWALFAVMSVRVVLAVRNSPEEVVVE